MMSFQFDGPNKLIYILTPTTLIDVQDLYSLWKQWSISADNLKYDQAMKSIGGDALSTTKFIAPYIELTNNWKLKPYSGNYSLSVVGNLFATGGANPFVNANSGSVLISMETTGNALGLSTTSTGSDFSVQDIWGYTNRTLTSSSIPAEVDYDVVAESVWTYFSRELTYTTGLTLDQEAKIDAIKAQTDKMLFDLTGKIISYIQDKTGYELTDIDKNDIVNKVWSKTI